LLDRYLRKDSSLDYQKIYTEMQSFKGFHAKKRDERLYQEVVHAYEEFKQTSLPTNV